MRLGDITFLPFLKEEDHPRFGEVCRYISANVVEFAPYQRTFERLVAERCIMTGDHVVLEEEPVVSKTPETTFAALIGVNQHAKKKVQLLPDLLDAYERLGEKDFLVSGFRDTQYFAFYRNQMTALKPLTDEEIERGARRKVQGIVTMYKNMRDAGGLAGSAKSAKPRGEIQYYDLPWTIDYFGTRQIRDGAHRRALAAYLGFEALPTLVYRVADTDEAVLSNANPYLRDNFAWFARVLQSAKGDGVRSRERAYDGGATKGEVAFEP